MTKERTVRDFKISCFLLEWIVKISLFIPLIFFYQQNSNTTVSILTFLQTFLNAQETQIKNCRQKRAAHERNRPECEQKANGITVWGFLFRIEHNYTTCIVCPNNAFLNSNTKFIEHMTKLEIRLFSMRFTFNEPQDQE